MKHKFLHKNESHKLIIFFNGWGMDEHPVMHLQSRHYDVLMFYDYSTLVPEIEIQQLIDQYHDTILIAWSMGVWAGQQVIAKHRDIFKKTIAINGTLCPIHDRYGIPEKTAQATLENFNEKQRLKFYYRMCRDREVYKKFIKNMPKRSVENQKKELAVLLKTANCKKEKQVFYDTAIVADNDYIIPTKNQLRFWPSNKTKQIPGSHFIFNKYSNWDDIV